MDSHKTVHYHIHLRANNSEGVYFDVFTAIKECIKEAKESIILIDNYIDAATLAFFQERNQK